MTSPIQRSGILLVDKPAGMSSADVLNKIKDAHNLPRIGHGGTLDPFATGLLVVLIGEATKIARFLLEGDKLYEATALLGTETDTGDHTGTAIAPVDAANLSVEEWQKHAESFIGRIRQTPPPYSAVKVKGKALYEYARKGQAVEVKARDVHIREFTILSSSPQEVRMRIACSGGTYIRVLAADLAAAAGSAAHLSALRRLGSSSFRVENAITLQQCLAIPQGELPVVSLALGLTHLPQVHCEPYQAEKARQGNLSVFDSLRSKIEKPGYFVLLLEGLPVAICNHNPMLIPFCSVERVFDPKLLAP